MTKAPPACTKCWTPLGAEFLNVEEYRACPNCSSMLRLEVLPAYFRETAKGSAGEALMTETEASCFYHPQKRAAVVCSECGRFLCSLCDLELEGKHYCSSCLEAAKEKDKIASIQNRRQLYDLMAFQLALAGFLIFYLSVVSAPAAIYIAIKYWKAPSSMVRGGAHARMIAAIVIASLQLIGMAFLIGFLVTR